MKAINGNIFGKSKNQKMGASLILALSLLLSATLDISPATAQDAAAKRWQSLGSLATPREITLSNECDYRLRQKVELTGAYQFAYYPSSQADGLISGYQGYEGDALKGFRSIASLIALDRLKSMRGVVSGASYFGASAVVSLDEVILPFNYASSSPRFLPLDSRLTVLKAPWSFLDSNPTNLFLSVNAQVIRSDQTVMFETFTFPVDGSSFELEEFCSSTGVEQTLANFGAQLDSISKTANEALRKVDIIIKKLFLPKKWFK